MGTTRVRLDPAYLPQLDPEQARVLDALSDAAITAAAEADPDNPPLTADELARLALARRIQRVRRRLGLSQDAFAARYGVPVATLRQWELGRRTPDRAALSYLRVIEVIPEEVAAALRAA
jgi:putative transcriptional regulator